MQGHGDDGSEVGENGGYGSRGRDNGSRGWGGLARALWTVGAGWIDGGELKAAGLADDGILADT
jgi:hypothetical protein